MMNIKGLVAGAFVAVAASASAAVSWTTDVSKAISTGTGEKTATWTRSGATYSLKYHTKGVTPGKWTSDFAAAKAYADTYNVPMLLFVGSEECGYCSLMKSTGLAASTFTSWASSHNIVMVFVEYASTSALAADQKSTQVSFVMNSSGLLPLMATYWKKSDGTTLHNKFPGRQSKMPSKNGSTCAAQLVASLDLNFGSWDGKLPSNEPDYAGGFFTITGSAAAHRLEAVAGRTTYVDVPLYRTAKTAATNRLQLGSEAQQTVTWAANVTSQLARVTIPASASAGQTLSLRLYDADGKTLKSSGSITVVSEPANSIGNPKWIGEDFETGEWTMDLDAALAKAKSATARFYTLAVVGGDLWCPYCQGLRSGVFDKAEFKRWAQGNNVNLVTIDMPQKDKTTATLLTRDPSAAGASGAAYLSRNMISDTDAKSVFSRNKTLSGSTWLPKSSSATRCGNPTVLLLNPDKTVAARLYSANDGKTYPLEETIARLNALLGHLGGSDRLTDAATTTLSLAVEDTADDDMQVNSNVRWYKLTNVPNGRVTFTTTGGNSLVLSAYEYSGSGPCTNLIATATNTLAVTFTTTSGKYLKVQGFVPSTKAYGQATDIDYSLTSAVTLVPSQSSASFKTKSGRMNMVVTNGTKYRLDGFTSYTAFTKNADGTYTAVNSGTIAMASAAGATVSYQIWTPGAVAFTSTSAKKMESDGSGTVTVARTGGSSGAATVAVTVDRGTKGSGRVTVTPATLTWKDGESAAKTVTYKIAADSVFNPDETFAISLAVSSGSASLGSPSRFTVAVSDTDDPVLPSDSYSMRVVKGTAVSQRYAVGNIKEGGRVTLTRSGKLPIGVKLNYAAASKSVVLSGTPKKGGTYTFGVKVTEARSDGKATGAETKFTVVVVDPASLKPGDSGYNAVLARGTAVQGLVPVYGSLGGRTVLAGTLDVKVAKTLKISAKYVGADGAKALMRGALGSLADNGDATATLVNGNVRCALRITAAGRAVATVTGTPATFGATLSSAANGASLMGGSYSPYAGYYVVSLPVDAAASGLARGGETAATGTGYVILKMNLATFARTGKVSYKGMLANGKTFSGSSYLLPDQLTQDGHVWGYVPVVIANKAGNVAGMIVRIRKNASADYTDDPRVIFAADAACPYWRSKGRTLFLNAYGNYYDTRAQTLVECCEKYYEKTTFDAVFDTQWLPSGTVTALPSATATVTEASAINIVNRGVNQLKLRFAKKTGLASGTAQVTFAGGRAVRCKVVGVLLVGWADCDCGITDESAVNRPVFSGTVMFKDGTVMRGFALDLK